MKRKKMIGYAELSDIFASATRLDQLDADTALLGMATCMASCLEELGYPIFHQNLMTILDKVSEDE